jgi:Xaa-Pro aminopeptidase
MTMESSQPYFQAGFTAADFRARHRRIYEIIGSEAVAVVQGGPPVGGFEVFRQTNELFYLTGLEVPQAYLLLDARKRATRLYLPRRDAKHAASEGDELTSDDADLLIRLTGVDDVADLSALESDLHGAAVIYTPHSPAEGNMACQDTLRQAAKLTATDPWGNQPSHETFFIELLRQRAPSARIVDLSPVLNGMRAVKTPAEIDMMRFAGKLTALAVSEAMRSTRPGVYEYQLGAIAEYIYRLNGARGASYRPIIAAGSNIWFIHYYRNNCQLNAGDLVLMDVAPDVCNYTSDIGRMWPVNGKYDDQQRQLYGFMVELHKALLRHLRPGVLPAQVSKEAREEIRPLVAKMKFKNPAHEAGVRKALESDGHLTHTVGMAVHDGGTYKSEPFKPGCVFALDPQMWIPEEKIYIRVEDTVVITETGVENLTAAAPLELDHVEKWMREPGMIQAFGPISAQD